MRTALAALACVLLTSAAAAQGGAARWAFPQSYVTPYPSQTVQTPNQLLMIFEYPNAIRWIPLDGRAHEIDPDPTFARRPELENVAEFVCESRVDYDRLCKKD